MFYTLLQPHGAQAMSASVKAWANALDAWRVAYLKAVETPMAAAHALVQGETPRLDASPTAPGDLAALTMTAWTETVKAAAAGAHAMTDLGPMRFEPNPFGLTGLFTVEPPSDATADAPTQKPATAADNVVSIPAAAVHGRAPVAPAAEPAAVAKPATASPAAAPQPSAAEPPPKPGKPSAPRKIGVGAPPPATPAARPAPPVIAAPTPTAWAPDDLTQIKGIGPKIAEALRLAGVTRFAQIAGLDAAGAAHLDAMLKSTGKVEREDWIAQAKSLLAQNQSSI